MNQQNFRFRPTVQQLEQRVVPAGVVTAKVIDGTLYVAVDNGGDQFQITGGGTNTATITSLDNGATQINGGTSAAFGGFIKGIYVGGGQGGDTIVVSGVHTDGSIVVVDGNGGNNIRLNSVGAAKGGYIVSGAGNDQIAVGTSDFGSLFSIAANAGDDFVSVVGNHFGKDLLLNGGAGNNTIDSRANAVDGGAMSARFVPGSAPTTPTTPSSNAPAVTITSSVGATTNKTSIPVAVSFSAAVTGFTAAQVNVVNGTVSNFRSGGDGQNYTFNVIPTAAGMVTISTPTGAGIAADGTGSQASSPLSITFDNVAPTVTVSPPITDPIVVSPIAFNVNFSKAVTSFGTANVTATNGTVASVTPINSTSFTVNVTPAGDGTVTLTVPANTTTDVAGNGNAAGSGNATSLRTAAGISATLPDTSTFTAVGTQGLKTKDIVVGTGSKAIGSNATIQVFYRGFLASNGNVFDQSVTTGSPANFTLSNLIVGFQQGVQGMRAGGERQIFIPSALGYGTTGSGSSIPPNSDLVFDVKVLSVS